MANAKFFEDNMEIIEERMRAKAEKEELEKRERKARSAININPAERIVFRGLCKDCGREYTITAGEARFYARNVLYLPKRCKSCRAINKQRQKSLWA